MPDNLPLVAWDYLHSQRPHRSHAAGQGVAAL